MPPMTLASAIGIARQRAALRGAAWLAACWVGLATHAQPATAPVAAADVNTTDDVAANQSFLDSTIATLGRASLPTAEAYVGLANAQRKAADYDAAAESYLAAIDVYRAVDGPFTPLAIPQLTNLGDTYYEARDNLKAVSAYSEARNLSRRVQGLHNEDQIEILDRLSRSLLDMNQLAEADEQQVEALRLIQRSHAPDSDEVLEAIYKYAAWLGERSLFQLERDQYTRALRIIRTSRGETDVRQVKPLLGIGNTYRQERNPAGMGFSALQDALKLLLEQPERDALLIATTLRDLGDWAVAFSKAGYEGSEYMRAWELLGTLPNGAQLRTEWFSGANYVLYEPISPRGLSTDPDALDGHVIASFDVDTQGNSADVEIVESAPPGFKDEAVLRHIRRSRFRPLMSDGRVVSGDDLAIQFKFRYSPEAVAANEKTDEDDR